ncbi:MAG TPA: murein biosynthesis integral membrane protein MurJ [Chloroflexota bacterium]|nr:murein biosynthesis integral membrane protein MurJ [Chloroflexota bacterium]
MATIAVSDRGNDNRRVLLGGYAALAEGSWMGAAQATDVVEQSRLGRLRPHVSLRGLFTREFTVAQASIILMGSFFLSALLGAIRQVLFNAQFGAGADASAYYAAFRLPDTLFSLIAGGALSSAMIPVLLSAGREGGTDEVRHLASLVLNTLLATFAVIVLLGEVLAPGFVSTILAPGFDAHTTQLTVTLTRIMLLQPLFLAIGSVAAAILNSKNQFLLTALSVVSHNIGLILGILASHFHPGFGIYGPTGGVVLGSIIQAVILLPGIVTDDVGYRPVWNLRDERLREVIALLVPNGLAVGVAYAGFIADTAFASKASQSVAIPALHNARMLVGLPIALFGQAIGQSAFPRLTGLAEVRDWVSLRQTLLRTLGIVVLLGTVAVVGIVVVGRPAIRLLFEHGKYGPAAAHLTYTLLVLYAVALPAYVATEVIARGLIALRDTRTPLVSNTLQISGRVVLMALFLGVLGARVVPVAFAIMASLETIGLGAVLFIQLARRLRETAPVPTPVEAS